MNDDAVHKQQGLDRGLTADLAALRDVLREVGASAANEASLLAVLAARRVTHRKVGQAEPPLAAAPRRRPRRHVWRVPFALAAGAALAAVTAVLLLGVERGGDSPPASAVSAAEGGTPAAAAPRDLADAFQPLAFSPGLSASQSYSVVRVRIPLAALAPGHAALPDATIEADLLVGEDGLASGIRFNKADTLFVSTVSNQTGERR